MYAIVTSYRGPTAGGRGSRIVASGASVSNSSTPRRAYSPYGHENIDEEHVKGRKAWIAKHCDSDHVFVSCADRLKWVTGTLPNGDTVHVAYLIDC